ncbi:uncharacterized protein METZ01_LOCUS472496, partial [marine metagenome]
MKKTNMVIKDISFIQLNRSQSQSIRLIKVNKSGKKTH